MNAMPPAPVKLPLRATTAGFRRFTVAEYHKLIEIGILTENDNLELLDGYLVEKMPHDPVHDGTIQLVEGALRGFLPMGWCLRVQSALTLSKSEPEPDVVVARGDKRAYLGRHPGAADIGLLIEVSNTTLDSDRDDKIPLYARDGIPVYWIVNLIDRQVGVYEQPSGTSPSPTYGSLRTYKPGDTVPIVLAEASVGGIPVVDLLP
jgi:Uma2 family endonuclease